jgi:ornithine carbamoyltransferase
MPARKNFLEFRQLSSDAVATIIDRANVLASAWADRRVAVCRAAAPLL